MFEPISWRGLTFQWDAAQSRYVSGRWSIGQPQGKWRGLWNAGALYIAGESSPESPAAALVNLCREMADTLKLYRREADVTAAKVALIGGDLNSTKGDPSDEQTP